MPKALAPIQIFRPGRHTACDGRTYDFSAEMCAAMARAYDPALYQAPLVVGHPEIEDPAYGWVKSLALGAGGAVEATPEQVEPQFAELVRNGRFRKISASLFTPPHPSNPKPGQYYLKHVGFLGAAAPAVRGLKPVQFAQSNAELVIEFAMDEMHWPLARMMRNLREWLIGKFSVEEADLVAPDYLVADLEAAARKESTMTPAYAAPTQPEEESPMNDAEKQRLDELEAENMRLKGQAAQFAQREAAYTEREQQLSVEEAKRRRAEIAVFCEAQVDAGRLVPHEVPGLAAMIFALPSDQVLEFAEGGQQVKKALPQLLRDFLEQLPGGRVDFTERAPGGDDTPSAANFTAPQGYTVDPKRLELHRKAAAHAKQHNISYAQALAVVA